MNEETQTSELTNTDQGPQIEPGPISKWLNQKGLIHKLLEPDEIGIENLGVDPQQLFKIVSELKMNGFNYLQCQGGYDEGPGLSLVCFYHLMEMKDFNEGDKPREVRLKVFLDRNGSLRVPSLYKLFRGCDWQERETYDMFGINFDGHPHPKRLLMPEDWRGWPLRKDYIQPDFYEMQDAY
ncbi:NAD(P)H-quinone oxidoreductase subunit J [Prochlorococcus marinus]|uniref:NAD(P)H-quinone oxidoreductase subunit J n=1 Tax=Prochlorococcus marinus (strain MIT 9211) TaxID=93059 RepID=NDHJ_PROM4|nr:NAD(P)H-quinone oxidoreductase subunit J [Prochlorococcus marinus]A9BDT9.1 RecName: Full=NAD(P)H-quinone oxidoreductase subunit J; AltName: Full=NAD(P)H dehydrogenase subunit J; AltName: Full=NADH-plastoquinone oxidoreductase subunit J; AltName: Full=NDH-1 subunit J; Short=NDH-J [Prochlorococcus marinus str. MIT 9211]ABX08249.1 putative respiratory-chain NADH dehydrogenase subunit [Prochlorococcus marinus str. MIT 9211]